MKMELMINDQMYQFNAGFGFMKKANSRASIKYDGTDLRRNTGLTYLVADLMDGDVESLANTLYMMNEGESPRLTQKDIEKYLESENTDIDDVFEEVLGFLEKSNCTKKAVMDLKKMIEENNKEQQEK